MRPLLLDLFCGAGGAAMGYHRAGFDVVGVDIVPQPRYPFTFHQADAMTWPLDGYEAIHASPPCQAYSIAAKSRRNAGKKYPDLLAPTRDRLKALDVPWVIENVPGAPLQGMVVLCGCQVGLALRRVRYFETSWAAAPWLSPHYHPEPVVSVVGHGTPSWVRKQLGYNPTIAQYRAAMGIDWMNRDELSQAIPPAYTEHIGRQLLDVLGSRCSDNTPAREGRVMTVDAEYRDLSDEALEGLDRLTTAGMWFVLGVMTWDTPEALLAAIEFAAAESSDYIK